MFCSQCGNEVGLSDNFCCSCGRIVSVNKIPRVGRPHGGESEEPTCIDISSGNNTESDNEETIPSPDDTSMEDSSGFDDASEMRSAGSGCKFSPQELLALGKCRGQRSDAQKYFNRIINYCANQSKIWKKAPMLAEIPSKKKNVFFHLLFAQVPTLRPYEEQIWQRLGRHLQNRRKYILDKSTGKRLTKRSSKTFQETSVTNITEGSNTPKALVTSNDTSVQVSTDSAVKKSKRNPIPSSTSNQQHQVPTLMPKPDESVAFDCEDSSSSTPSVVLFDWGGGKFYLGLRGPEGVVTNAKKPLVSLKSTDMVSSSSLILTSDKFVAKMFEINARDKEENPNMDFLVCQYPQAVASSASRHHIQVGDSNRFEALTNNAIKLYVT